jgi:superfamily II DNA or RNA helicase
VLRRFAEGDLQVISAPRVLDEGVDVPEADLAVIIGASRSRRQMIQRMGRVLRRKPDHRRARFAVLYVESTIEDPAQGAQETFLEEITEVADEVRPFGSASGTFDAAVEFLRPFAG